MVAKLTENFASKNLYTKIGRDENYYVVDNTTGKIAFYSIESFVENIVKTDNCFICGAKESEKPFNDEHIISNWILKQFNLHNTKITLPNGEGINYGEYKINCCVDCNTLMGDELETPMSDLLCNRITMDEFFSKYTEDIIYKWMNLIFIKMHLRDKNFWYELDERKPDRKKIGEQYEYRLLHHIHCLARTVYTGVEVDRRVWGSLFIGRAKTDKNEKKPFDIWDHYATKTIGIRVYDHVLISTLNDSRACLDRFIELHAQ